MFLLGNLLIFFLGILPFAKVSVMTSVSGMTVRGINIGKGSSDSKESFI